MHPYFIVIFAAVIFLLGTAWVIIRENRRQRARHLREFGERYGRIFDHVYSREELQRISASSRKIDGKKEGYLDDITWNDLEMDVIFGRINQTLTTAGEEYLYRLLRLPKMSSKELEHLGELTNFFQSHKKEREKMQLALVLVGKDSRCSLGDAVSSLENAPVIGWISHGLLAGALLAALLLLPVFPVAAVFLVFALVGLNAFLYQTGSDRKQTEPYRHLFASLRRILDMGRELERLDWSSLENCQRIVEIRKRLAGFEKKAFWFIGRQAEGGGFLDLVMDYLKMLFHIDLLVYPSLRRESLRCQAEFQELLDQIGELDAAISIASFRKGLPWYGEPELSADSQALKVTDLYHPLVSQPVANTITAGKAVLLTGSNASGKSTFLKAVAVNAVLAQTIFTCTARSYHAACCRILTSIALRDSIRDGESYFMAEIRSLKRILDACQGPVPVLCVIDEVLRGTNTVERIAASSRILGVLAKVGNHCFAATHDLELTAILGDIYENYHFEETVEDSDIHFHYQLKQGPCSTRNALTLLELTGYDENTVRSAKEAAKEFQNTGIWKKMKGV